MSYSISSLESTYSKDTESCTSVHASHPLRKLRCSLSTIYTKHSRMRNQRDSRCPSLFSISSSMTESEYIISRNSFWRIIANVANAARVDSFRAFKPCLNAFTVSLSTNCLDEQFHCGMVTGIKKYLYSFVLLVDHL